MLFYRSHLLQCVTLYREIYFSCSSGLDFNVPILMSMCVNVVSDRRNKHRIVRFLKKKNEKQTAF